MASVFDPLIALANKPIRFDDASWMIDQINRGGDSAAAILGGAFLENVLKDAILAKLVESKSGHSALFRRNGPLSNFDSMILIAYAIGLVDKETRHDLTAVRHIRNAFAHAPRYLYFELEAVKSVCDSMNIIRKAGPTEDVSTPLKKFVIGLKGLLNQLMKEIPYAEAPLPGKPR